MITDIIFLFITLMLEIIHGLLSVVTFIIPTQLQTYLSWAFSFTKYFYGILPVANLLAVLGFLFSFLAAWFGWKVLLRILGFIPHANIGKKH